MRELKRINCKFERINTRINEAQENNVFYKAFSASFEAYETTWEEGQLGYVNSWEERDSSCTAKTLQELFDKVKSKLYMDDKDFVWSIDLDNSSLHVNYLGNNDGELASKYEIDAWKKGKVKLYNVDGIVSVRKVMGEFDVPEDELEDLARSNKLETF